VFGGRAADEQHARAVYDAHNRNVSDSVPPERLLVYDLAAGTAPTLEYARLREYLGAARRRSALRRPRS
jgi:hypothetical protein